METLAPFEKYFPPEIKQIVEKIGKWPEGSNISTKWSL